MLFIVFVVLDLLFWSKVDFGTFMPPSPGDWDERVSMALVTAFGPVGMTWFEALRTAGWVFCGLIAASVLAALRWPRFVRLEVLAHCGIAWWWFLGFAVAAIRIT
jgi:hypothetical protein